MSGEERGVELTLGESRAAPGRGWALDADRGLSRRVPPGSSSRGSRGRSCGNICAQGRGGSGRGWGGGATRQNSVESPLLKLHTISSFSL